MKAQLTPPAPYGPYGQPFNPYGQPMMGAQMGPQSDSAVQMMKMEIEMEKMRSDQRVQQEANRANQEIAAIKFQAAQEASAMKMANELMKMRYDQNQQVPYGQTPYGQQVPYGQAPYANNANPMQQQLPPAVQPIIINTAEQQPSKKVIDVDAQQAYRQAPPAAPTNVPPDSVMTSTTTTTTVLWYCRNSGNDFYDVDGFYDSYNGNFNGNK